MFVSFGTIPGSCTDSSGSVAPRVLNDVGHTTPEHVEHLMDLATHYTCEPDARWCQWWDTSNVSGLADIVFAEVGYLVLVDVSVLTCVTCDLVL